MCTTVADRSSPEMSCTTPSPTCPKVLGTDKQKPKDKSIKKDKKILCMACNSHFTERRSLLRGSIHLFSGALTTDSGPISLYKCITVIAESENPQQGQRTLWAFLFQSAEPQVRPPRHHGLGVCSVMLAWHSNPVQELYCSRAWSVIFNSRIGGGSTTHLSRSPRPHLCCRWLLSNDQVVVQGWPTT